MPDKKPQGAVLKELVMLDDNDFRTAVIAALREGDERMSTIDTKVDQLYARTNDMVEVFEAMRGGFKVLEWLGRVGKIVGGIAAVAAVVGKATGWKWPWQ